MTFQLFPHALCLVGPVWCLSIGVLKRVVAQEDHLSGSQPWEARTHPAPALFTSSLAVVIA